MKRLQEIQENISKKYIEFLKKNWNKNLFYKFGTLLMLLLTILVWQLVLLALCSFVYHKFDKPMMGWLAVVGVLIITYPITLGWIGAFDSNNAKDLVKESSCIGPDGKKINLSKLECDKFNNAWENDSSKNKEETVVKPTNTPIPTINPPTPTVTKASTVTSKPTVKPTKAPTNTPKPVEKYNIVVTSQIVKKIDGKHRYFFDIRNKDTKPFEGSVTISLFTSQLKNAIAGDTFNTNKAIEPELGTSVYTDANTGPPSVHGENGISKFKYTVKKGSKVVNSGES